MFEEYNVIAHRVSLKISDTDVMDTYAWKKRWSVGGLVTSEDNEDIVTESIYRPADGSYIVDYIIDKLTQEPFILIRVQENVDQDTLDTAYRVYKEILAKLPIYSLSNILEEPETQLSEGEIHALGKGYDPDLKTEIQTTLSTLATSTETTPEQKKAAIIAIGYISDPKNFNPILEQFTQDSNSEVAELAQSMLQAGHAILNR
ncbi:hypothetical protein [Deinococcus xinjiangensis]|uniref:hypothetical protein n=1 Tax=Deinococcus xinjiangensis TaxID=457454 RepID=UPI0033655D08